MLGTSVNIDLEYLGSGSNTSYAGNALIVCKKESSGLKQTTLKKK